jgi:hypothetical protein
LGPLGIILVSYSVNSIKRVTVMLPDDLHLKLKILAVSKQTTLNDTFLQALELYMQALCDEESNVDS